MNILWASTEGLSPLDDFERARVHHMLRELNREHPVTHLALGDGRGSGLLASYRDRARSFSSALPHTVWKYCSAPTQQRIEDLIRNESIDIAICDSLGAAVNVPAAVPIPTILFQHRVEAVSSFQPVLLGSNFLRKRYAQQQWYRMYAFERSQCRRFDHVIAVSPEDLAWFAVEYGVEHVSQISAGVDTDFFAPSPQSIDQGHLVFSGVMDFPPNEDAMIYFASAILPRLVALANDVTLSIVGPRATPRIQEIGRDPRVRIEGGARDVRPYLERAAVVIVPQRIGGGARSEILQSMAMEKPVVATTVAVDGLPLRDGEHLLIADTPERFASAVARLLQDPSLGQELGRRAGSLVRSRFTWSRVAAHVAETCAEVAGRRTVRAEAPSRSPIDTVSCRHC